MSAVPALPVDTPWMLTQGLETFRLRLAWPLAFFVLSLDGLEQPFYVRTQVQREPTQDAATPPVDRADLAGRFPMNEC